MMHVYNICPCHEILCFAITGDFRYGEYLNVLRLLKIDETKSPSFKYNIPVVKYIALDLRYDHT